MKHVLIAAVGFGLVGCASRPNLDPVIPYSAYPRAAEIRRQLAREAPPLCWDRRELSTEVEGCVDTLDAWNERRMRLEAELARFVPLPEQFEDYVPAPVLEASAP